jgi:hypothetical protein
VGVRISVPLITQRSSFLSEFPSQGVAAVSLLALHGRQDFRAARPSCATPTENCVGSGRSGRAQVRASWSGRYPCTGARVPVVLGGGERPIAGDRGTRIGVIPETGEAGHPRLLQRVVGRIASANRVKASGEVGIRRAQGSPDYRKRVRTLTPRQIDSGAARSRRIFGGAGGSTRLISHAAVVATSSRGLKLSEPVNKNETAGSRV